MKPRLWQAGLTLCPSGGWSYQELTRTGWKTIWRSVVFPVCLHGRGVLSVRETFPSFPNIY